MFYVELIYTFKRIVGKANKFSDQFKKIINRYKTNLDITWMSCGSLHAWFKIMVYSYDFLSNCTTVGQADSITAMT